MNIIRTFSNIVNINLPDDCAQGCAILGTWNYSIWPVKISSFIYQLFHNSLPVAARLGNRYRNVPDTEIDERCFWCTINNFNVPGRETFGHVYFECPTTSEVLEKFCTKYVDATYNETERRTLIFFGMDKDQKVDNIWQIVGLLLLYCIWEGKIRRRAISYLTIESNLFFFFDSIAENHKWVKTLAVNKNDNWCRNWRGRAEHGRG